MYTMAKFCKFTVEIEVVSPQAYRRRYGEYQSSSWGLAPLEPASSLSALARDLEQIPQHISQVKAMYWMQ